MKIGKNCLKFNTQNRAFGRRTTQGPSEAVCSIAHLSSGFKSAEAFIRMDCVAKSHPNDRDIIDSAGLSELGAVLLTSDVSTVIYCKVYRELK